MQEKTTLLQPLLLQLNSIQSIGIELEETLFNYFEIVDLKKDNILLQEGDICKSLWYLIEGIFRSYHNIKDKEVTSRIMFSGHIVISAGSFFKQTFATESIETLSDCKAAVLSFDNLQKIYNQFPEFNYHGRIITEEYFYKQEQRLYLLRKHDAKAKYEYFIENYAAIIKEIPQRYIASFLNIAPETLSRVRSKLGTTI